MRKNYNVKMVCATNVLIDCDLYATSSQEAEEKAKKAFKNTISKNNGVLSCNVTLAR